MSSSTLSQWAWLDPALRPASDEEAPPCGRESSSPTDLTTTDRPAAVTLAPDDVKLLSGALHCEIVDGVDGGPRVAQIYTLPDPLPCPWPPMGPFSPVRLEDLRMTEVPLALILDLKQVSEGVKVLKWRAFEPQTPSFGATPLSTTTNINAGIPAISQDAKREQHAQERKQEKAGDVVDTVDIASDATISTPSKTHKGGRKRAIEGVYGAEELPEGRAKALKRTYVHDLGSTYCTTCGEYLATDTDRRNHPALCGTGQTHISCNLCGAPMSRRDAVKRHQRFAVCRDARAYYKQHGRYIHS
ncbi:hypothetical protein AB1N83_011059 [Pleurotus pulmonarius]